MCIAVQTNSVSQWLRFCCVSFISTIYNGFCFGSNSRNIYSPILNWFECHLPILSSENVECSTMVNKHSTIEDTENANNTTDCVNVSSPNADKHQTDCKTVSNNNWWGSWISSAKTKVNCCTLPIFIATKSNIAFYPCVLLNLFAVCVGVRGGKARLGRNFNSCTYRSDACRISSWWNIKIWWARIDGEHGEKKFEFIFWTS